MFGAKNPPRLPSELIKPIPAAAAYPVRNSVGRVQKIGCMATKPIAANESPAIASTGFPLSAPDMTMPKAVTSNSDVPISRCLRVRSASPGKNATDNSPNTHGIAVTSDAWKPSFCPVMATT